MKLRMAKDSIRLRILRSELNALASGETLREEVRLAPGPEGVLRYSLHVTAQPGPIQVLFHACAIQIQLSPQDFRVWFREDQVGIYERLDFGVEGTLELVLEKDFACLDRNEAENQDTFEHPHAGAVC